MAIDARIPLGTPACDDALVVVQSSVYGGAMNAARAVLKQGKALFVVEPPEYQEVREAKGLVRVGTDDVLAHLGVTAYGWTFINRDLPVPDPAPYLRLTAPSGAIWEWNADNATDCVEGSATEFCQVVTQTRNVADTQLRVSGEIATRWMSLAQCFAGSVNDPPAPGERHTVSNAS